MVCFDGRDLFSFSSFLTQLCILGRELQRIGSACCDREFMLVMRGKTKIGIRSRKAREYFLWRFCFVGDFGFVGNSGAIGLIVAIFCLSLSLSLRFWRVLHM
ncbi:hypothetical protein RchiOBHm_Chr2g0116001 [Rosa chinensis]|uniref:Transmembrane protein n=1 Tax=Rosa chinensis TaxID=74649 RepID=A0A2P6RR57_ROSCH|nr:hypothetical protein RchiOBHm_Chr2g0116001 [Rosa chinensis]